MNKTYYIILAVVAVVVVGAYLMFWGSSAPDVSAPIGLPSEDDNSVTEEVQNIVVYTDSGYSPNRFNIKVGDTVIYKNESSEGMWTASAMHPSHIVYSGTSLSEHCPDVENITFDACASTQPGDSWSFKFNKAGEWTYHNHVNPANFGRVVVEE